MEQHIFNVIATLIFIYLGSTWKTGAPALNLIYKYLLILMGIAGLFVTLHSFGYIVKI
jgi:hypothetical protein